MGEQNPDPTRPESHPEDYQIPPDPLLDSGTFIHVDGDCAQNGAGDGDGGDAVPPPAALQTLVPNSESEAVDGEELGLAVTPVAGQKKSKRMPEDMAERPEWLPEDWRIEIRMRTSGATAGSYDRYYFSPTGKKFRSKTEVVHFLETGTTKRKKVDADGMPPASSESKKARKPNIKKGDFSSLDFDFKNQPQNVTWTLTNASHDIWTPICDEVVTPEAIKRTWDNAFSCITYLEGGK